MKRMTGRSGWARKGFLTMCTGGIMAVAVVLFGTTGAHADNALTCYRGDKENSVYMGEISGANFENAAGECNSFYADCNGECFGCYFDNELSQTVCIDNQGRKFTR